MKLLVIEDDPGDVRLTQLHLQRVGFEHELESAASMAAGLELAAARGHDLILTDLGLPDADGTTVVERLIEVVPEVPVVVLSGSEDEGVASVRAGAQDFIPKSELSGVGLVRSIRFAIERQGLGLRLARDEDEVRARVSGAGTLELGRLRNGLSLRSEGPAAPTLRESAPKVYATLAERYAELLQAALSAEAVEEVEHVEGCYALADKLAYMASEPSDLIDLHMSALHQVTAELSAKRESAAKVGEAATELLIRMLSYLASAYRQDSLRQRRATQG